MYKMQGSWRLLYVPVILISALILYRIDQFLGFIQLDTPWFLSALSTNPINEHEAIGKYKLTSFEKFLAWNLNKGETLEFLRMNPDKVISYYGFIKDIESLRSNEIQLDGIMFSEINEVLTCGGFIRLALTKSRLHSSGMVKDMLDVVREHPVSCKN